MCNSSYTNQTAPLYQALSVQMLCRTSQNFLVDLKTAWHCVRLYSLGTCRPVQVLNSSHTETA